MRRVVVLGAGIAGYNAARELTKGLRDREEVELSLISEHPHFFLRPLLPEVVTGWTKPQFALIELTELQDLGPLSIHTERVVNIDLAANQVETDRETYAFDYLLIALGGTSVPPAPWSDHEHVYSFASDTEAARLRHRLSRLSGEDNFDDVEVAVIGGGPTGVDFAATLAERHASGPAPKVFLFEQQERILPSYPRVYSEYAEKCLEKLQVRVLSNVRAELVGDDLDGAGRSYAPDVIVWASALEPDVTVKCVDAESRDGRLVVDEYLRLPRRPDVFAAGSTVFVPDKASLGFSAAASMGRVAARNLLAAMAGRAPEEFSLASEAQVLPLGQRRALAQPFGVPVFGRAAWALYRLSLLRAVPDLVTQIEIVGSWAQQWLNDALGSR